MTSAPARMGVGITLPIGQGLRQAEVVELAVLAEDAGLDVVAIGEYASSDAIALAAAIAMRTERIRIETSVLSIASRSSASLAMAAATLADLSGGRFVLGLGAGSPVVSGFHDRAFERPLEAVATVVSEVRSLLAGQRLTDRRFELRMPLPWPVPIILSALNPRMLQLAATRTEGVVLPLLCSPELVGQLAAEAATARAEDPGSTPAFDTIAIQHGAIGDNEDARLAYKREIAGYFLVPTYRRAARELVGEDGLAAAAAAHERGGMAAVVDWLPGEVVERMLVQGDREVFADRLERLASLGCDSVRFNPVTLVRGDCSHARRIIEVLGDVLGVSRGS